MKDKTEISVREALLYYTQLKIEMAEKFRKGIRRDDLADFDRKLGMIDRILKKHEKKLAKDFDAD